MTRSKHNKSSAWLPVLLCSALLVVGCDSSPTIEIGAIRVTVTVIGSNFDPDGYTIRVSGEGVDQSQAVAVDGEVLFGVASGDYLVELLDKAPNCVVDLNPQVVRVSAGNTAEVLFNTLCA